MMFDSSLKQQQATNQRSQSFFLLSHAESCKTRGRHSAYKLQVGADYSGIEWHDTEAFRDLVGDFKHMISLGSAVGIQYDPASLKRDSLSQNLWQLDISKDLKSTWGHVQLTGLYC